VVRKKTPPERKGGKKGTHLVKGVLGGCVWGGRIFFLRIFKRKKVENPTRTQKKHSNPNRNITRMESRKGKKECRGIQGKGARVSTQYRKKGKIAQTESRRKEKKENKRNLTTAKEGSLGV